MNFSEHLAHYKATASPEELELFEAASREFRRGVPPKGGNPMSIERVLVIVILIVLVVWLVRTLL